MPKLATATNGGSYDFPPESARKVDPELYEYLTAVHTLIFGLDGQRGRLDAENVEFPEQENVSDHGTLTGVSKFQHHGGGSHDVLDQATDVAAVGTLGSSSIQRTTPIPAIERDTELHVEIKGDVNALVGAHNGLVAAYNTLAGQFNALLNSLRAAKLLGGTATSTDTSSGGTTATDGSGASTTPDFAVIADPASVATTVTTVTGADLTVAETLRQRTATIATTTGTVLAATDFIPANCLLFGVFATVTEAVAGTTAFQVGTEFDADAYGDAIGITVGSTSTIADFGLGSPQYHKTPRALYLTAATGAFTGGEVLLTAYYWERPA